DESTVYWPLAEWMDAVGADEVERRVGHEDAQRLSFAAGADAPPATAAEIETAACRLATALARETKVLFVAEDVHWAEDALIEMLRALAPVPDVSVVASTRPHALDSRSDLGSDADGLRLRLDPLDHDAAAQLVRRATPDLDDDQRERLV